MKKFGLDTFIFLALSISIGAWIFQAWSNPPSQNRHNPYSTHVCQSEPCEGPTPPPSIDTKTQQTKIQSQEYIEQWRADRSDLAAQWETADATRLAFRMAVLGVLLLLWTIWATKKGVSVTEKVGQMQTRAYLSIADPKFFIDKRFGWPAIKVTIKNTGNSPAREIRVSGLSYQIDVVQIDIYGTSANESVTVSDGWDHPVFVPDIMSGDSHIVENLSIISGSRMKKLDTFIIDKAIKFIEDNSPVVVTVQCFFNISYKTVFNESIKEPFTLMDKGPKAHTLNDLDLVIKRNLTAKQVEKFAEYYEGDVRLPKLARKIFKVFKHHSPPET